MNSAAFHIKPKLNEQEMLDQFPLIQLLNPKLNWEEYKLRITDMQKYPYHMLGVFEGNNCIAVSGYWIQTKLYCGKYLEMDNVVVLDAYRSKGVGKLMSDALHKIALANECQVIMLDAYIENEAGQRFYEREGFKKKGFHFIKKI